MKTNAILRSITVVVILFLAANISFAGIHDPKATSELKKVMQKEVPYPKFAQENLQTGFAVISFDVDSKGKILLKAINASTPEFKDYVEEKLKDITFEKPELFQGETQYYRFDFQLINDY
jgi:hypothetical protein